MNLLYLADTAKQLQHKSNVLKMHAMICQRRSQGMAYPTIALELGLSEATVRTVCAKYEEEEKEENDS